MAKLKLRHFLLLGGDGTMNAFKMSMKKSLVVAALLGFLFIVSVSGQPEDAIVNSNSSSISNTSNLSLGNSSSDNVKLSCVCDGGVPCEKNLTSTDCPNGRVTARRDCSCCFVCAKQLTESCNENDALCDSDYGLICGSDQKCQAKTPCSDDTSCSNDLMCVGGACADPCKVLPDVCREMDLKNGMCIVRNHRPICSCPAGQSVNSEKLCAPTEAEKVTHCEMDGLTHKVGSKFYKDTCGKVCECETSGSLNCKSVEGKVDCQSGTIPLSTLGGEMTRACKLLIGHGNDYDGCCVPEQCANVTVPHDDVELQTHSSDENDKAKNKPDHNTDEVSKGGREFKITDSTNNKLMGDDSSSSGSQEDGKSVLPIHNGDDDKSSTSTSEQVMILQRTDHSAVIELPKSDAEAILSIALTSEHNKDPSNMQVWKDHKIPQGLPQITLSDLIQNTSYTLKYTANGKDSPAVQFITNEMGTSTPTSSSRGGVGTATGRSMNIDEVTPTGMIADSTESASVESNPTTIPLSSDEHDKATSSAETESGSSEFDLHHGHHDEDVIAPMSSTEQSPVKGCMYNGSSYEVGHEILNGCDEKCTCMEGGKVKCSERCLIPTFKKGALAHDEMCTEEAVDECCVIIACARGGSPIIAEPRELIPIHPEPCDSVKCGKNARCLGPSSMLRDDDNQTNQTLCLCNEGFVGDPYDEKLGCQESSTPSTPVEGSSPASVVVPSVDGPAAATSKPEGCTLNNQTFEFGDEHFDGCNYKCRCENSGEFTCLPRCNYRRDDENEIPMGCEIQKDPSDNCCEMLVCHGKPLESGTRKDDSTTLDDGCVYKNKTYARDEKFYDGCESQCMCFSNGDVTCQPRCPPSGPHSGEDHCVTLEDPVDKCCKVTICGNQTLYDEVMKAEAAKKTSSLDSSTELPSSVSPATGIQRSMTSSEEAMFGEGGSLNHASSSSEVPPAVPSLELEQHELDIKITMVVPLNSTAMMITVSVPENELSTLLLETMIVRFSHDLTTWRDQEFRVKDLFTEGSEELHTVVTGLSPGQQYYFKVLIKTSESNVASGITKMHSGPHAGHIAGSVEDTGSSMEGHSHMTGGSGSMEHEHMMLGVSEEEDDGMGDISASLEAGGVPCDHKGKTYQPGQEFYDNCDAYCVCDGRGNVTCVEIDCPRDGRELIDESCVRWEPDLKDFKKEAPFCCPDMVCVQHAHCKLDDGYILPNFEELPHKLTGCDKTCQCLYGNITCHPGNNCPPLSDRPPAALACPPEMARQIPMLENECCYQWACINHTADGIKSVEGLLPQNNINRQTTNDNTTPTHIHTNPHSHHHPHDTHITNLTHEKDPNLRPDHALQEHEHDIDLDEENEDPQDYDQFVPPPPRPPPHSGGGNRPSIVGLDKISPVDLQEILHHLANLGGGGDSQEQGPPPRGQGPPQQQHDPSFVPGTYTSVPTLQHVAELEREAGGRYVGRAEDGSYIVAVPQSPPHRAPTNVHDPPQNIYPHVGRGPGPRPRPGGPPQRQRPILHAHSPNAPSGFPGHFPPLPPPFGLPHHPPQHSNDATKVSNIIIQPLNESTLQIDFTVSPILVGLHGHVEVLYTKEYSRKPNPAQWESKVFQQAEDLIDNTHLQLFLTSLEPDTDYHMQIRVVVMAQFQPTSDVLLVRTPAPSVPTTTLPPEIIVDPEIQLAESGSRSVKLHWKKIDEYDNLVDGVQIAYKESEDKVYSTTPLIHRSVTEYELTNLTPNKDYEVNLLFIPFHTDQKTVLKSEKAIFIKTDKEEDEYAFDVGLSPGKVSQSTVELRVSGVPPPEDKYVSIYQVYYSMDGEKEEQKSYFKVPKTETSKRATLTDLRPGTKYTIWLEAFLTNGKKKRSNVIDVVTKAGELPSPEKSEQETQESKPELPQASSYYGALVALAIVAAMSILGIIALLMILIKKQNQAKAPINDRKSESSYDNPSFKSYDIESNGHLKPSEL